MATFAVRGRKKGAVETITVDAATRDEAIAQVVAQNAPGEEIEIMDAQVTAAGATGATGATGTMMSLPGGTTGASGPTGP